MSDLDVVPCGVLQTLDDGTVRRVNRTFCGWFGVSPEAIIGRRFQDLLTIGGKIFHHTHWAPLLRMQGSISEVKLELVHGDGVLPIIVNVIRRDDSGTIVHEIAAYVARDRDRDHAAHRVARVVTRSQVAPQRCIPRSTAARRDVR